MRALARELAALRVAVAEVMCPQLVNMKFDFTLATIEVGHCLWLPLLNTVTRDV